MHSNPSHWIRSNEPCGFSYVTPNPAHRERRHRHCHGGAPSVHTTLRSLRLDSKIDRCNSKCITLRMLMRYCYRQLSRVVSRRRSTAERQIPMCSDEQMLPPRLSSGLHRGAPVTPDVETSSHGTRQRPWFLRAWPMVHGGQGALRASATQVRPLM
jgi:hypothetical protein